MHVFFAGGPYERNFGLYEVLLSTIRPTIQIESPLVV